MPLIVLEGLDGAGKSTQMNLLTGMLAGMGKEFEYIHFPRFDTPVYGDLIARFLRGELGAVEEVDPYLVALLFAGDRADAGQQIEQWLDEGKFVLLDRYVNSNIAFQCAKLDDQQARDVLKEWILNLEFSIFGIPRPDISLFLDVPFSFTARKLSGQRQGSDRTYLQGAKDIHEQSLTLQERVREVYLWLAGEDTTMHIVDCTSPEGGMAPPDVIFGRIADRVAALTK